MRRMRHMAVPMPVIALPTARSGATARVLRAARVLVLLLMVGLLLAAMLLLIVLVPCRRWTALAVLRREVLAARTLLMNSPVLALWSWLHGGHITHDGGRVPHGTASRGNPGDHRAAGDASLWSL